MCGCKEEPWLIFGCQIRRMARVPVRIRNWNAVQKPIRKVDPPGCPFKSAGASSLVDADEPNRSWDGDQRRQRGVVMRCGGFSSL